MAAGRARTRAFHALSDFTPPDLGAHEVLTSGPERTTAVLFDTEDLRLTRRGIDVRYVHPMAGPGTWVLSAPRKLSSAPAPSVTNQLDEHSPTEQLHELRILVKRARYAALAVAPVRPEAAPHARALARLQEALGEINDMSITEERVSAAVASGLGAEAAYGAGLIIAAERHRSEQRRAAWPQLWDELRRKKVRAWLDSAE